MNIFDYFKKKIMHQVLVLFKEKKIDLELNPEQFTVEPPRESRFGDLSTNICMVYAKKIPLSPSEFAELLKSKLLVFDEIETINIKSPGFLNFKLNKVFLFEQVKSILLQNQNYGSTNKNGQNLNIEFVSANPTGPLHVGHVRGAIIGDVLGKIYKKLGYNVTTEYYVNDAGNQIDILAKSVFIRYKELVENLKIDMPEDYYPGEYLISIAKVILNLYGKKLLNSSEEYYLPIIKEISINENLKVIKNDLKLLGIYIDIYTSEKKLIENSIVDKTIKILENKDLIYNGILPKPKSMKNSEWVPRKQKLFKSTLFGDDEDRTISKSDGSLTYFISDIAYHLDKHNRTNGTLINIWGADHAGYVKRMLAAVNSLTGKPDNFIIKLCQLVNLSRDSKIIKMSKRKGTFITLKDIVNEVGSDVVRFIMLTRKNDQTLDFDFNKVVLKNKENPVFYVQYAYARICSVLRKADDYDIDQESILNANLNLINHEIQMSLCKKLILWPRTIENAAKFQEPHRIAFYLIDLASEFHSLWALGREDSNLRFFHDEINEKTYAHLAIVKATKEIIFAGLDILSVNAPEEM